FGKHGSACSCGWLLEFLVGGLPWGRPQRLEIPAAVGAAVNHDVPDQVGRMSCPDPCVPRFGAPDHGMALRSSRFVGSLLPFDLALALLGVEARRDGGNWQKPGPRDNLRI